MSRRLGPILAAVLAMAGCGPENDDGTRSLAGTGGTGGSGGAAVEPIGDPAAEAQLCEDWPDCPPGIYADDQYVRFHYGCGATVVRDPVSGSLKGIQGQRSCSKCYVGPPAPHTCTPKFVGRCKAPSFLRAASCSPGQQIVRPDGTPWMVNCTGYEAGDVICWDQTPPTI